MQSGSCITGSRVKQRGRKILNVGELAEPRFSQFLELLELCEKYKRKNQYV